MLPQAVRVAARIGVLVALLGLMAIATTVWRDNNRLQQKVENTARRFRVDERRTDTFETLRLVPAADLGADVLADAAINDSLGEVSLRDMTASQRQLWLTSLMHIDDELGATRVLLLDAAAARPGWPYHWSLLGQVEYAFWRRQAMNTPLGKSAWIEPLRLGAWYAGGDVQNWGFVGGAYLESWPLLSAGDRRDALLSLRFALNDPDFVRRDLVIAYRLAGAGVLDLVPDDPAALSAAIQASLSANLPREGERLVERWEKAECAARARDLTEVRKRIRLGDLDGARAACRSWVSRHRFDDFADQPSIRQLSEVVSLWPSESQGEWAHDTRHELVLFFIEHPEHAVNGESLARMVESMSGVPVLIRAQAALRADDSVEALRMQHDADVAGAFEWTPFICALARHYLQKGKPERARAALSQLSSSAAEECNSRLLSLEIDNMSRGTPIARLAPAAEKSSRGVVAVWRRSGAVAVCLGAGDQRLVDIHIISPQPVLVDLGWDGLRARTVLCSSSLEVRLSVRLPAGIHTFFAKPRPSGALSWTLEVR
ncbi:MAG TPA: hypothetical protein VHL58_11335 [Thermoanaerobaculia bacterium]|nr:hypothetical protein [Thermoanaerobaculia bacterium]